MANRTANLLGALILLAVTGCASPSPTPPYLHCVDSIHNVWCSGQPKTSQWRAIQALGVTRVVKLNTECEGSDRGADSLGIPVERFPITTCQQWFGPVQAQLDAALSVCQSNVLFHCTQGANRSGTLERMYRVIRMGQSRKEAAKATPRWWTTFPALRVAWSKVGRDRTMRTQTGFNYGM